MRAGLLGLPTRQKSQNFVPETMIACDRNDDRIKEKVDVGCPNFL